jgi:hypothetical protein
MVISCLPGSTDPWQGPPAPAAPFGAPRTRLRCKVVLVKTLMVIWEKSNIKIKHDDLSHPPLADVKGAKSASDGILKHRPPGAGRARTPVQL